MSSVRTVDFCIYIWNGLWTLDSKNRFIKFNRILAISLLDLHSFDFHRNNAAIPYQFLFGFMLRFRVSFIIIISIILQPKSQNWNINTNNNPNMTRPIRIHLFSFFIVCFIISNFFDILGVLRTPFPISISICIFDSIPLFLPCIYYNTASCHPITDWIDLFHFVSVIYLSACFYCLLFWWLYVCLWCL